MALFRFCQFTVFEEGNHQLLLGSHLIMQTCTILAVIQGGFGLKGEGVSEKSFIIFNIIYSNIVKSMKQQQREFS